MEGEAIHLASLKFEGGGNQPVVGLLVEDAGVIECATVLLVPFPLRLVEVVGHIIGIAVGIDDGVGVKVVLRTENVEKLAQLDGLASGFPVGLDAAAFLVAHLHNNGVGNVFHVNGNDLAPCAVRGGIVRHDVLALGLAADDVAHLRGIKVATVLACCGCGPGEGGRGAVCADRQAEVRHGGRIVRAREHLHGLLHALTAVFAEDNADGVLAVFGKFNGCAEGLPSLCLKACCGRAVQVDLHVNAARHRLLSVGDGGRGEGDVGRLCSRRSRCAGQVAEVVGCSGVGVDDAEGGELLLATELHHLCGLSCGQVYGQYLAIAVFAPSVLGKESLPSPIQRVGAEIYRAALCQIVGHIARVANLGVGAVLFHAIEVAFAADAPELAFGVGGQHGIESAAAQARELSRGGVNGGQPSLLGIAEGACGGPYLALNGLVGHVGGHGFLLLCAKVEGLHLLPAVLHVEYAQVRLVIAVRAQNVHGVVLAVPVAA